jgi:hypothetical protein
LEDGSDDNLARAVAKRVRTLCDLLWNVSTVPRLTDFVDFLLTF